MSTERVIAASLMAACTSICACGVDAVRPPRIEDEARVLAPVPTCVSRLAPAKVAAGFARQLKPSEVWPLVFPAFDANKKALPEGALSCTGKLLFADPAFVGAASERGWPRAVVDDDVAMGSGGERLKVAWLKTHRFGDDSDAGALALVRAFDDHAELYGVGAYHARTKRPFFQVERMGSEVIVSVLDDACVGAPPGPCESSLTIFLPRQGKLLPLVTVATDRRAFGFATEPGAVGRVEYRLTGAPEFSEGKIRVYEQMTARDDSGRILRRAELDRLMRLEGNSLVESEGSLWTRLYPKPAM